MSSIRRAWVHLNPSTPFERNHYRLRVNKLHSLPLRNQSRTTGCTKPVCPSSMRRDVPSPCVCLHEMYQARATLSTTTHPPHSGNNNDTPLSGNLIHIQRNHSLPRQQVISSRQFTLHAVMTQMANFDWRVKLNCVPSDPSCIALNSFHLFTLANFIHFPFMVPSMERTRSNELRNNLIA